jgi:hypothetical protein
MGRQLTLPFKKEMAWRPLLLLCGLCVQVLNGVGAAAVAAAIAPIIAPHNPQYDNEVTINIFSKDADAIYYTLNSTNPTGASNAFTYIDRFTITTPGTTTVKAVATYANNGSLTEVSAKTYVVVKIFEGVATVSGHLRGCAVGLDVNMGSISSSKASLLSSETSTSTSAGGYRIRSLRASTGGVVLDTSTASTSDVCQDTATGKPHAMPLASPCPQTLTPLTTAAVAAMAAGNLSVAMAVAATAAVVGVPLSAPICGFNDAPRRALDGDPLGIASLARAAQVQALAAYSAAAIHGLSGKKVSVQEAGAAAFLALGTEIARRHAAASTARHHHRHHRRSLLVVSTAPAIDWANADEMARLLDAAAAALPPGLSLSPPWSSSAQMVAAVHRLLHADTAALDVLARQMKPTASDLAQVQGVIGAVSVPSTRFDDIVALGLGSSAGVEAFEYKYGLRLRPSPPPPSPRPPPPPSPPMPPPAFSQVAPLNNTVGGMPIWALVVVAATVFLASSLGSVLYYRRVRKGRKARGEVDPEFGDTLRSPNVFKRRGAGGYGHKEGGGDAGNPGGLEGNVLGVNPGTGSDAARAAAAGGGTSVSSVFARPDLAKPGVLSRTADEGGVSAPPDLAKAKAKGESAGVLGATAGAYADVGVGSYGDEEEAGGGAGSYGDEGDTGSTLRWNPEAQMWTNHSPGGQLAGEGGYPRPGAIVSPMKPKSVNFGRPPSTRLKKGPAVEPWAGASASGAGSTASESYGGGGASPSRRTGDAFARRSMPMNPAVVDAMSRLELVRALETRGVAHDDLLEDDAEDGALRQRLKHHACASRDQLYAAESSATEATNREFEKTLETPAGEWF